MKMVGAGGQILEWLFWVAFAPDPSWIKASRGRREFGECLAGKNLRPRRPELQGEEAREKPQIEVVRSRGVQAG